MIALALFPLVTAASAAPAAIADDDPPVRVSLDVSEYDRGEDAEVKVKLKDDGYLVVLRATTEGRIRVLFPLDPQDDNFLRGRKTYQIPGRGGRESFTVDDPSGTGTVLAAVSQDPFRFEEFTRGDHWDYGVLGGYQASGDPEAQLIAVIDRMAGGAHYHYDLLSYRVHSPQAAARDYYGYGVAYPYYDPWWGGCWGCVGAGISIGFSFGWGYPGYYYPYYPYYPYHPYHPYYPYFPHYPYYSHPYYGGYYGYGPYRPYTFKPGLPGQAFPTPTPYRPRAWAPSGFVKSTPVGFRPRSPAAPAGGRTGPWRPQLTEPVPAPRTGKPPGSRPVPNSPGPSPVRPRPTIGRDAPYADPGRGGRDMVWRGRGASGQEGGRPAPGPATERRSAPMVSAPRGGSTRAAPPAPRAFQGGGGWGRSSGSRPAAPRSGFGGGRGGRR